MRKVYNLALAARTQAWARQERVNYNATSAMLTAWKKTEELAFLNDVSSVPLQQTLRHLQSAFTHFFARRAKYPRFKSRKKSRKSAEYTTSGFRFRDGKLIAEQLAGTGATVVLGSRDPGRPKRPWPRSAPGSPAHTSALCGSISPISRPSGARWKHCVRLEICKVVGE